MKTRTKVSCAALAVASLPGAVAVAPVATANAAPGQNGDVLDFAKWDISITQSNFTMYDNLSTYATHRSGSGNGNLNECTTSAGPAPDGKYDGVSSWHQPNFNGSAIYGRVFRMQNKACWNGTIRTALFIHTEETPQNTQGSVESQRWDGDNDYYSEGCIKLSRSENGGTNGIGVLHDWWHSKGVGGGDGTAYYGFLNVWWA